MQERDGSEAVDPMTQQLQRTLREQGRDFLDNFIGSAIWGRGFTWKDEENWYLARRKDDYEKLGFGDRLDDLVRYVKNNFEAPVIIPIGEDKMMPDEISKFPQLFNNNRFNV